jgi:hypothetical protein
MKRILSLLLITSVSGVSYAQMVNGSSIHVSEGAVVTVNTPMTNTGTVNNKGRIHLKSDLKNDATFKSAGEIVVDGDSKQVISGSNAVETAKLSVSNDVNLQTEMRVSKEVNFASGIVTADQPLHFEKDAKATGANDFSHVVGTVQKSGDQSFQFPLGDGSRLKTFEVANPKNGTLEAQYVGKSPLDISSELDISLSNINETEYWTLKSTNSEKVNVNLAGGDQLATLNNGVWVKQDKSLNAENGSKFTSGKGSYLQKEIGVWPNPTQGEFNLKLSGMRDSDNISIDITNQDGRVIMNMAGTVKELRKAYKLPSGLVTTNLTIRVINGEEAMTQNLILAK